MVLVVVVLATLVVVGRPAEPQLVLSATAPSPYVGPSVPVSDGADLDADIGSLMVISWSGGVGWPSVRALMTRDHIGGILLFTPNFGGTPAGVLAWSNHLQALATETCATHPMLVMLDEEGGEVANIKAPFAPPWPAVMASSGPGGVHDLERVNGQGLRAAGVDLNLAPVADVRYNPRDAVIGGRSFGPTPSVVAPLVDAAVRGLHDGGVGATVKHFPGLGGAAGDPHVAIPSDPESEATWERVQEPAFAAGIAAGADAVMVTAMYAPGLGAASVPAMFSAPVVSRLRTQLGFGGVIMSDSLSMGGIGARWSLQQATVMAIAAGNDMVLLGNGDLAYEASAIAAVKAAVLSGKLDRGRLHESAVRVNALRDRWGRQFPACKTPMTSGLAGVA